jgi:hypothetical protein
VIQVTLPNQGHAGPVYFGGCNSPFNQPFSRIGIGRIPIRADVSAPLTARLAGESRFDI